MRIMAWNIRHGGGGARMPLITLAILEHTPDVVVLSEFRAGVGGQIRGVLSDHGLTHHATTPTEPGKNGLLIASRGPIEPTGSAVGRLPGRWLEVVHTGSGVRLGAVHAPDDTIRAEQKVYWHDLLAHARGLRDASVVLTGDFNAGRRGIDSESGRFGAERSIGGLAALGYVDAWRTVQGDRREYTWFSHRGRGFRLDGAFVSQPLGGLLQTAVYSQLERTENVSDHAVFRMDLDVADAPAPRPPRGLFGSV